MNFRKLNEELDKLLSLNEISTELKQRYIAARQKQIDDLEKQIADNPVTKAWNEYSRADDKYDRFTKIKTQSSDKFLVGSVNDVNFYIRYVNQDNVNDLEKGTLQFIQGDEILRTYPPNYIRDILDGGYYLNHVLTDIIPLLINQGKVQKPEDLDIRLNVPCWENFWDAHTPSWKDLEEQLPGARDYVRNETKPDPEMEETRKFLKENILDKLDKLTYESFELHELDATTMANAKLKRRNALNKAYNKQYRLKNSEKGKERQSLIDKVAMLKRKVKDVQDNIKGIGVEDRRRKRGTWIFDIFSEVENKIDQLKQNYPNYEITFDTSWKEGYVEIIISLLIDKQNKIHHNITLNNFKAHIDGTYQYRFTFSDSSKFKETKVDDEFRKSCKRKALFKDSKVFYSGTVKSIGEHVYNHLKQYLSMTDNFMNAELSTLLGKIEKSKNRAPRQDSKWTSLYDAYWGLKVYLKQTASGYQVISQLLDDEPWVITSPIKDWKKALDRAAKKVVDQEDLDDMLGDSRAWEDNEYADYYRARLEELTGFNDYEEDEEDEGEDY